MGTRLDILVPSILANELIAASTIEKSNCSLWLVDIGRSVMIAKFYSFPFSNSVFYYLFSTRNDAFLCLYEDGNHLECCCHFFRSQIFRVSKPSK